MTVDSCNEGLWSLKHPGVLTIFSFMLDEQTSALVGDQGGEVGWRVHAARGVVTLLGLAALAVQALACWRAGTQVNWDVTTWEPAEWSYAAQTLSTAFTALPVLHIVQVCRRRARQRARRFRRGRHNDESELELDSGAI